VFLGHFALGFAAKKADTRLSLGTAFVAAQLADVAWPVLVLSGLERVTIAPGDTAVTPLRFDSYPYSHSLAALVLWGAAVGAIHYLSRGRARAAMLLALLVVSHWFLDVASHRPDVPLFPGGGPLLGLGLWRSRPATFAVETVLFAGGVALYLAATRGRDGVGTWGLAGLVGLLAAAYLAAFFGPPPPTVPSVAVTGLVGAAILLTWGAWVDRHRRPR
jgi:uncharacterized membrane protein YeaQ/YmgE (transglycosylase-associated protein family)